MSPIDALISSENCSEGPGGGADEPANQPAWSRSDYTYKAMKAPAVHRVQGWGRRAGLCRAVWEGAVHRTHCGVGRRREAHEREAAPPPALRPPPSALRCHRPPRLCVLLPPPSRARAPAPPPSRPARPGGGDPVAPPYLAPEPPRRRSPTRRQTPRAGEGRRRSSRLLLRREGVPISPPVLGLAPRGLHSSPSQCHRLSAGQPACFRPTRGTGVLSEAPRASPSLSPALLPWPGRESQPPLPRP